MLVKFFPVILLPAIYRRWDKKLPIAFVTTIVICYLPYVLGAGAGVLGFLPQYAKAEGLQSGERYYLLDLIDYILDWCGVVHDLPPRQSGASRFSLMTTKTSPFRTNFSADWSWSRTVADETCSRKIFSQPAAESSLDWASKPAT